MMRTFFAKTLLRLAHWLSALADGRLPTADSRKGMPYALAGSQWSGTSFVDSFQRNRQPTPNEILAELKNTAWTCASINAATCANYPPRLYVITEHNQPRPKCLTKALVAARRAPPALAAASAHAHQERRPHRGSHRPSAADAAPARQSDSQRLRSLGTDHAVPGGPRQRLLVSRPRSGAGRAARHLDFAGAERDAAPRSQQRQPRRLLPVSQRHAARSAFAPEQIIHFAYPDPRDPYTSGLSPLRACFEQAALTSDYAAFKKAEVREPRHPRRHHLAG